MTPMRFVEYARAEFAPAKKLFAEIPTDKLDWKPAENMMSVRALIHHLSGRTGAYGITTGDFSEKCWADADAADAITPALAAERIDRALDEVERTIGCLSQKDWETKEVSLPWGWKGTLETISHGLVINHFLNHKMQLFCYLKLLGRPVDTSTLYP